MVALLSKFLIYGLVGLILECLFTGIWSAFRRDKKTTCQTYLWMIPIYGGASLLLGFIHESLQWNAMFMAPLYVSIMYIIEFCSGWLLQKTIGVIPWDYGRGKWTPMGLIQIKYAPLWLLVALAFNPLYDFVQKIFYLITRYG